MTEKIRKRDGLIIFSEYEKFSGLKKALSLSQDDILFELKSSNLKGRGGAGFPISTKWMLTAAAQSSEKYVVCNADEGEPGTFKDRVLLKEMPYLIFEGMIIAGYTIGAKKGIVYLRGEYNYLVNPLNEFLDEMKNENLLGENILGKDFSFEIEIFSGHGAYVCGEETALLESLEGQRGEARNRPPFPVNRGYKGFPTTVNNVESLSTVPHIIMKGGSWYSQFGTEKSKGTKLISVSGDCEKPGVYEIEWGTSIYDLLELVKAENTKAVQVGGASGVCVNKSQFDRTIAYEDLSTGGSIMIFNESRNMLAILKNFMEFFVEESCGQCTPCRIGNQKLLAFVEKIIQNEQTFSELNKIKELAETMKIASKCGLGQSSPNPFLSILENFKEEIFDSNSRGKYEHV